MTISAFLGGFAGATLALGLASPVAAQLTSSLDVGAASVTYHNGYRLGVVSLTPTLRLERANSSVLATGTLSRLETGMFSSSGGFDAYIMTRVVSGLRAELGASAGGSANEDLSRTAQYLGHLRLHALRDRAGLWIGGGAGRSWNGVDWQLVRTAELGGWWDHRLVLAAASFAPVAVGDSSFADALASARLTRGSLELGGAVGQRFGDVEEESWVALSATWWLHRALALNGAVGSYPTDYVQGIPGGRYVSVGVRIASRPPLRELARLRGSARAPALARPVADRLEIQRHDDLRRTVRVEAPAARRVEIMGDFTEWNVVALAQSRDGHWRLTLPLVPGTYRFNVRVDGGRWGVPRGVTMITDDFEGVVGILIVQ
ncbi:MAG TPA: glycogen-binding domain-containing protein [Gemmatimonadaceae bacterium]|nr:glycogen-binding domain-containing protein [Gemmatimonadaceae bacterium]